jgi:hypothetical protein
MGQLTKKLRFRPETAVRAAADEAQAKIPVSVKGIPAESFHLSNFAIGDYLPWPN